MRLLRAVSVNDATSCGDSFHPLLSAITTCAPGLSPSNFPQKTTEISSQEFFIKYDSLAYTNSSLCFSRNGKVPSATIPHKPILDLSAFPLCNSLRFVSLFY